MSDLSKCFGEACNQKDKCWRHLAPAGMWQTYIAPKHTVDKCEEFLSASSDDDSEDVEDGK